MLSAWLAYLHNVFNVWWSHAAKLGGAGNRKRGHGREAPSTPPPTFRASSSTQRGHMSIGLSFVISTWGFAVFFLFRGDLCLAAAFGVAGYVFLRVEAHRRSVLNRPDPRE